MIRPEVKQRLDGVVGACIAHARQKHRSPLEPDIRRLSELFTTERGSRARTYMRDPALRRAYLGFFVPHNVAKLVLLLEQLAQEALLALPDAPRVWDVGAGPLTGCLAVFCVSGRLGPSYAIDVAETAMEDGAKILAELGGGSVTRIGKSVTGPFGTWRPPEGADLVVAANVLNELGDPRRALPQRVELVSACIESLRPQGRVLLVEPGTRVQGRALMAVRDALARTSDVRSPCCGAPSCPLLKTPGDWCHGELEWEPRPREFVAMENAAQLKKERVKSSHLLLARANEVTAPATGVRLVGGLMRAHDAERRYGCGASGLVTLRGRPLLPPPLARPLRGAWAPDAAVRGWLEPARR